VEAALWKNAEARQAATIRPRKRRGMLNGSRTYRFSLVALALLFLAKALQQIWIADIWWQLATGRTIVATGSLPRHDIFSYTAFGSPWIELRWLYCVLLYAGWVSGGAALLVLVQTLVVAAALVCAVGRSRRVLTTVPGVCAVALALGTVAGRFVVRPEIVSYLLVPVFLERLDRLGRERWPRGVWALPVLQVLWVNLHTLFVLGPVMTLLYAFAALVRDVRRRAREGGPIDGRPALLAVLVVAACWLNPYGTAGALFPLQLFREIHKGGYIGNWIGEFQSPLSTPVALWGGDLWCAAALALVSLASFAANRRRLDPARLMLWAAMLYLALVAGRNVSLFGYVALWVTLRNLDEAPGAPLDLPRRLAAPAHVLVGLCAVALAWDTATDRAAARNGQPRRFGLGVVERNTAEAATRFLLDSGARPQLFHAMSDGSWLIWAAAGRFPVFIDGRLEVYGDERVGQYLRVATEDWNAFAGRWGINCVLLNHRELRPLLPRVLAAADWVLVYLDHRELLFVRNIPEHAALIRRWRIDPEAPFEPRGPEPEERPQGWRRWMGSRGRPWYSEGMAEAFLSLGAVDNAARFLQDGLKRFPHDLEMRVTLAEIYRVRGEDARARELLAGTVVPPDLAARGERLRADLIRQRRALR
jgi:hypothetical protein